MLGITRKQVRFGLVAVILAFGASFAVAPTASATATKCSGACIYANGTGLVVNYSQVYPVNAICNTTVILASQQTANGQINTSWKNVSVVGCQKPTFQLSSWKAKATTTLSGVYNTSSTCLIVGTITIKP